ncbi:MAG TPA: amino acid permease [Thermoanaerobaculia bacterium]|nr:amino acid permease [Thermoanaerobaculia bacterium]
MIAASPAPSALRREIGLWQGTALNVIDMVGVGPFVTLPLILAAMGGGRAIGAWMLGALLAICDGLVTAELSAELPQAGGSYAFLREAYGRETWGKLVSFVFLFQVVFSAPLSIASGAIGFSRYLRFTVPAIPERLESPVAAAICLLVMLGLFRRIGAIGRFSFVLWIGVLLTLGVVIALGLPHLSMKAFKFWEAPIVATAGVPPPVGLFGGLGAALLIAIYDYLGYYNICYLAEEVVEPSRTIPRVIVLSIGVVAVLYILMNACVVSVLPMERAMTSKSAVSDYVAVLAGRPVATAVTVLILWTAFASIFSLTLGYSRILYAAGRDGNFFRVFARLHPTEGYPAAAIAALGVLAALFSFLSLGHVLKAIISIRALIPFVAQIAGALVLRRTQPDRPRPFRMWLYPIPALVALLLWGFVLLSPERGFKAAGLGVLAAGTIAYLVRSRLTGDWPWRRADAK